LSRIDLELPLDFSTVFAKLPSYDNDAAFMSAFCLSEGIVTGNSCAWKIMINHAAAAAAAVYLWDFVAAALKKKMIERV
jgi:hypothetical protein